MLVGDALALYCLHRAEGERPAAFFRRALLHSHPDKVSAPLRGLPRTPLVLEARAAYRACPAAFEQATLVASREAEIRRVFQAQTEAADRRDRQAREEESDARCVRQAQERAAERAAERVAERAAERAAEQKSRRCSGIFSLTRMALVMAVCAVLSASVALFASFGTSGAVTPLYASSPSPETWRRRTDTPPPRRKWSKSETSWTCGS